MSRLKQLRTSIAIIVAMLAAFPVAAQEGGEPIAPTKMFFKGTAGDVITEGNDIEISTENGTVTLVATGVFAFLGRSSAINADISFDVRDVGRYHGDFIKGQLYTKTIGRETVGQPKGPYMTASATGRPCNDDLKTTGQFEVKEYKWQSVYYPAGSLDRTKTPAEPRVRDQFVGFAITRYHAEFSISCNGGPPVDGFVDFYAQPFAVPQDAVQVIGPVGECFNFQTQVGTGLPCSASPGSGGGSAPGAPVPNLPPLPPAPDVNIVLPPSLVDLPTLQLSNSGTSKFTFTTAPASSSINADVHLSVTSDANEGDNFNVSISPSFIPAPGIGEATVDIAVGPNTFPRDYLVTVTALANDKVASSTIVVKVACDPPMILGIDQPRSQRVDPNTRATLTVKPAGSGPFAYQWYSGRRGNTRTPISGATDATFTTPAVTESGSYWVRVSNACGTIDSSTVTVSPR